MEKSSKDINKTQTYQCKTV